MLDRTKITYMGQPLAPEELLDADATTAADYFAPVTLSARAIDRASQIVPDKHWIGVGLHTWLSGRANQAFGKMAASATEIQMGKLKYVFEYGSHGPILKDIIYVP